WTPAFHAGRRRRSHHWVSLSPLMGVTTTHDHERHPVSGTSSHASPTGRGQAGARLPQGHGSVAGNAAEGNAARLAGTVESTQGAGRAPAPTAPPVPEAYRMDAAAMSLELHGSGIHAV